jgi:3-methyladenine DNA glycosylase AlkD
MNLSSELEKLTDTTYLKTNKTTIPTNWPMLGVRIPEIKKLVQKIPKEEIPNYLETKPANHEEILARGFLIARLPYEEMLKYFDSQITLFDNWCTVDTFCAALRKSVKKNEADFLERKVEPLLKSQKEFETRTGLVCLLDLFMSEEYLSTIFEGIESLKDRNEYYVKMAAAWLLTECYIKFPNKTEVFMNRTELNNWTFNKTISKICDSYRVSIEDKDKLRKMRKS